MKKYILFFLLSLISIGSYAQKDFYIIDSDSSQYILTSDLKLINLKSYNKRFKPEIDNNLQNKVNVAGIQLQEAAIYHLSSLGCAILFSGCSYASAIDDNYKGAIALGIVGGVLSLTLEITALAKTYKAGKTLEIGINHIKYNF